MRPEQADQPGDPSVEFQHSSKYVYVCVCKFASDEATICQFLGRRRRKKDQGENPFQLLVCDRDRRLTLVENRSDDGCVHTGLEGSGGEISQESSATANQDERRNTNLIVCLQVKR